MAAITTDSKLVDVTIHFSRAQGLPKMDIVGSADPYFVADLGGKITYVSTVLQNTLEPRWDETWNVKNVPEDTVLRVRVMDKDKGRPIDDYIGKFSTSISSGEMELAITGPIGILKRERGRFWLNISINPSTLKPTEGSYIFDGPIRFTRHPSPTVGFLTNLNRERLYSTWKLHIKGVHTFFRDVYQGWNTTYRAAQAIFGPGPGPKLIRSSICSAHRMLYARSTQNAFGVIQTPEDVFSLVRGGQGAAAHRVKPAVYTYIIGEDDTFRFSETGAAFFVDFASKHALHASCAERVRYSGEFHLRPAGGWDHFSDETRDDQVAWELVIDNNSGTYSPDAMLLPNLRGLLEYNFPGFAIYALDHNDPALDHSRKACRDYALKYRGIKSDELQPHVSEGEETLQHLALTSDGRESFPETGADLSFDAYLD